MTIRQIEKKDFEKTAIFLEEKTQHFYKRDSWIEKFSIWWEINPNHESRELLGWIIEDSSEIRGFIGFVPSKFIVNEKSISSFSLTSWYINDNYRGQSLPLLQKALRSIPENSLIINTTPSKIAKKIFKGLGFKSYIRDWNRKTFIMPLNPTKLIKKKFPKFQIFSIFGKLIQLFWGPIISLYAKNSNIYKIDEVKHFDKNFEDFFTAASKERYLSLRDSKTMNYQHFSLATLNDNRKAFTFKKDNKIVAYCSVNIVKNIHADYITPIDMFYLEEKFSLKEMVKLVVALGKAHDSMYIRFNALIPKIEDFLRFPLFFSMKIPHDVLYKAKQIENFDDLKLHFSLIDGDRAHFIL